MWPQRNSSRLLRSLFFWALENHIWFMLMYYDLLCCWVLWTLCSVNRQDTLDLVHTKVTPPFSCSLSWCTRPMAALKTNNNNLSIFIFMDILGGCGRGKCHKNRQSPKSTRASSLLLHRFTFDLSKLDNHGCVNSHYFHRINRDPTKQMCASVPIWCNGITNRISWQLIGL